MTAPMAPAQLIQAAEDLVPIIREHAAAAESARRPMDEVIEAARQSGLFSMMVPKVYGGHEADIDTMFEVALILSRADTSMGWLLTFYIEHNFWLCGYPENFQREIFANQDFILAPATLDVSGGQATKVAGGYQLDGQWQWGTGIVHADWVLVGALVQTDDGMPEPLFFAMPRSNVETIDTWHMLGMCGTGSWDIKVDGVFVPEDRVASMLDLVNATGISSTLHTSDLYRTPLIPILALAASTPMLGAAHHALDEYRAQTKAKIASKRVDVGGAARTAAKPARAAGAALDIEAAELLIRSVVADVMKQRNTASLETRSSWLARIAHAVFLCRDAVQLLCSLTGASGGRLENPMQRALRDISTGSNHVVFDREVKYGDYGNVLLDEPIQSLMV